MASVGARRLSSKNKPAQDSQVKVARSGLCFRLTVPHDSSLLDYSFETPPSEQIQVISEKNYSHERSQKEQSEEPSFCEPEEESKLEEEIKEREEDYEEENSEIEPSESGRMIEVSMKDLEESSYYSEQIKDQEEERKSYEPSQEIDSDDESEVRRTEQLHKSEIEPQLRFTQMELEYLLVELKLFFELPMFSHNLNCAVLLVMKGLFCFEKRKWDHYLHQIAVAAHQQGRPHSTANFLSYIRYRTGIRCIPISEMLIGLKQLIYDDEKHFFRASHARHFLSLDCLRDSVDYQILSKLKLGLDTPHSAGLARFFRHPIGRIYFPSFVYLYEKLIDTFEERIQKKRIKADQRLQLKRLQVEHLGQLTFIIEDYYRRFEVVKLDEEDSARDAEGSFNQKFQREERK